MVRMPWFGKERAGNGSQEEFKPFDGERILLEPFLYAPTSEFAKVNQVVTDSGISSDRVSGLMNWYSQERARIMAERGEQSS